MKKALAFFTIISTAISISDSHAMAEKAPEKENHQNSDADSYKYKNIVKCYGVAKKDMNDCGTSLHACASAAIADNESDEWIFLKKHSCEKIAGSRVGEDVLPKEYMNHEKHHGVEG